MEVKKYFDRFVILNDDRALMGSIHFTENEKGFLEATETFVDAAYRGQGLAKILVDMLVAHARINNKKIIPLCSYVNKTFIENPDYKDVWEKNNK